MFRLYDGRDFLYQWDVDCKLIVDSAEVTEVHFCNGSSDCSLVCEVYEDGSLKVVDIPNILLQDYLRIKVYAYDGKHTRYDDCFEVIKRSKPEDYVYTETEVKRWEKYVEDIEALKEDVAELEDKVANIKIDEVPEHTHKLVGAPKEFAQLSLIDIATSDTTAIAFDDMSISCGLSNTTTLNITGEVDIAFNEPSSSVESVYVDDNKIWWFDYGTMTSHGVTTYTGNVNTNIKIKFFSSGSFVFTRLYGASGNEEAGFMSLDMLGKLNNTYSKEEVDTKLSEVDTSAVDCNLTVGLDNVDTSVQQVTEAETFASSVNTQLLNYARNGTVGANNGLAVVTGTTNRAVKVGAFGEYATMLNGKGQARGNKSHVEGSKCVALENNAHAEGNATFAAGAHSHSEGSTTTAIGNSAHAEGIKTLAKADYSHAEGNNTKATGNSAHAQNFYTEATGDYSHAEGNTCKATNSMAHAEGYQTEASGYAAHSQGGRTKAKGAYTLAGGFENIAGADYQTVLGKANKEDADKLFIIGNGDLNEDYSVKERKNALTVDTSGNVELPIMGSGLILVSEGGRRFKLTVDNLGVLKTTEVK